MWGSRGLIKTRPATALPCRDGSARRHTGCAREHAGSAGTRHWHRNDTGTGTGTATTRHGHGTGTGTATTWHGHGTGTGTGTAPAGPRLRAVIAPTGDAMALTWHGHSTNTRGRGTGIAPTCLALAPTWHGHGAGTVPARVATAPARSRHQHAWPWHQHGTATVPSRPQHQRAWGHHPGAAAPPVARRHVLGPVLPGVRGEPPNPAPPKCGRLVFGSYCTARSRCCRDPRAGPPPEPAPSWGFKTFCTKVKSGAGIWGWGQAPPHSAPWGATAPLCPPTQLQGVWWAPPPPRHEPHGWGSLGYGGSPARPPVPVGGRVWCWDFLLLNDP